MVFFDSGFGFKKRGECVTGFLWAEGKGEKKGRWWTAGENVGKEEGGVGAATPRERRKGGGRRPL